MAWLQKKTPEEEAAEAAAKARAEKESEEFWADYHRRNGKPRADREREEFLATPAGLARLAFERGDHVFQVAIDVMNQQAIIIALVGSDTEQETSDPSAILNSVCCEGWELLNGSFVFVAQQQQSRDKFLSSGQNVAIQGQTVGYYLFKRCARNRRQADPRVAAQESGH